jgi:hypothetical protein
MAGFFRLWDAVGENALLAIIVFSSFFKGEQRLLRAVRRRTVFSARSHLTPPWR